MPLILGDLLETIKTAVMPVVMIAAGSTLILGVGNKHQSMSDRIRALMADRRSSATSVERRQNIDRQIALFRKRIAYSALAHRLLYSAIALLLAMVLLMLLTPLKMPYPGMILLLFGFGVSAMLGGIVAEILELHLANKTLDLEMDHREMVPEYPAQELAAAPPKAAVPTHKRLP
jgi:hypothetical protein